MFTACFNPEVFMDFLYVYCSVVEENWQMKKKQIPKNKHIQVYVRITIISDFNGC